MRYFMVSLGGILGANLRLLLGEWVTRQTIETRWGIFPWGTFLINSAGSFALGLFMTIFALGRWQEQSRLLVAVGFLGAFTTFSTFSWESLQLLQKGRTGVACAYLLGSVAVGVLGAWGGAGLGRWALGKAVGA